jgi:hypothetical protein
MRSCFLVLAAAILPASLPAAGRDRPNIVLILADDIGITGFSCYGGDAFRTPHIDALARSGIRFERCFSAPLCGPSRAQLLTGRYGFRTGVVSNETGGKARPESPPVKDLRVRSENGPDETVIGLAGEAAAEPSASVALSFPALGGWESRPPPVGYRERSDAPPSVRTSKRSKAAALGRGWSRSHPAGDFTQSLNLRASGAACAVLSPAAGRSRIFFTARFRRGSGGAPGASGGAVT